MSYKVTVGKYHSREMYWKCSV